jgi:hypothetical protein
MWHHIYLSVRLTLQQKLDGQNPILWKQYISLFDKDILLFLKQVDFLDPIHSIHFLAFKFSTLGSSIPDDFSRVGLPRQNEFFLEFFLDPSRSGKYHLTPQHHADIVAWMIQYYHPLPKGTFVRLFQSGDGKANTKTSLAGFLSGILEENPVDQVKYMPIDIHLPRVSLCAEQLIKIIRFYNPDTFPFMSPAMVRGIVVQYYS